VSDLEITIVLGSDRPILSNRIDPTSHQSISSDFLGVTYFSPIDGNVKDNRRL
jgi:hypothetical protein